MFKKTTRFKKPFTRFLKIYILFIHRNTGRINI